MIITKWTINHREANQPLLEALLLRVPGAPQSFLRQLCKKQRVTVNDQIADADRFVHAGETIGVKKSQRWLECLELSRLHPDQILYEDDHCLVLVKPSGLAIHRAVGHEDNLLHRAQDFLSLRKEKFQVAPVHRLDIGTSGAVVLGKGRAAISQLGQMIMAGQMVKHYLALVSSKISLPGQLNSDVPAKGKAKSALSLFKPVANTDEFTLLELELITGRHHQIRYQLASAGWPIIGDKRYQGKIINGLEHPFLHCQRLSFPLPATDQPINLFCPLSADLVDILAGLGFSQRALDGKV